MNKIPYFIILILVASCQKTSFQNIPEFVTLDKSNSFLKINPHDIAPLSAELHLSKPVDELTIKVKGQDGETSDLNYTWKNTTNTIFPIVGMYFNSTNTILLSSPGYDTKVINIIITNKPSDYIKNITVTQNNRSNEIARHNFLTFLNPVGVFNDLFAIDNFGKIRWYQKSKDEIHSMKFTNINGEVAFSIINTVTPKIDTFNMTGKLLKSIQNSKPHSYTSKKAPKRFHHDMYKRKNQNIIVLDKSTYGVEDTIVELNPQGKIVKEIKIGDWIRKTVNGDKNNNTGLENLIFDSEDNPYDEYKSEVVYPGMPQTKNAIDWAHINAISFDENSETLFLSFRQHGIFAFDYNNEELKWIFIRDNYSIPAPNQLFYNFPPTLEYVYQIPALKPYIVTNGPDHPHAISWLSNNQFMVFDNSGNDGEFPAEGSRLMVFSIDNSNKTAHIEWEYRHTNNNNNELLYSQVVSDIDKTPFNSFIGTFGTFPPFVIAEIDQKSKKIIFEATFDLRGKNSDNQSDITVPIVCPTTRLTQNGILLYRSEYQSIYPSTYQSID